MYTISHIRDLVAALPFDLLSRIVRTNAQFDILSDADQKMGWGNKVLESMQDELCEQFRILYCEALDLMPAAVQNEQPNADGEFLMQGELEYNLRRL